MFYAVFHRRTDCLVFATLLFAAAHVSWQLSRYLFLTYTLLLLLISVRTWHLGFCNWVVQSPCADGEGLPRQAAPLMLSSGNEPGIKKNYVYMLGNK